MKGRSVSVITTQRRATRSLLLWKDSELRPLPFCLPSQGFCWTQHKMQRFQSIYSGVRSHQRRSLETSCWDKDGAFAPKWGAHHIHSEQQHCCLCLCKNENRGDRSNSRMFCWRLASDMQSLDNLTRGVAAFWRQCKRDPSSQNRWLCCTCSHHLQSQSWLVRWRSPKTELQAAAASCLRKHATVQRCDGFQLYQLQWLRSRWPASQW